MAVRVRDHAVERLRRKAAVLADVCRIASVKYRLRTRGFASTLRGTGLALRRDPRPEPAAPSTASPRWAGRLSTLEQACRRWPGTVSCLERALVLGAALPPGAAQLAIGVGRHADRVIAHAWLEVDGESLELTRGVPDVELSALWG